MNRREYMNELAEKLSFLPEETRAAALVFYAEMLDDRMEDGMDEMSAVAAMESTDTIAARLRAENPGAEAEKKADREQPAPDKTWEEAPRQPLEDEAMQFSDLADRVMKSVSEAMENVPQWVNKAVEQAQKATKQAEDDAMRAARIVKQDVEKAVWEAEQRGEAAEKTGEYERRVFTCPASALQAVQLTVNDMPVCVRPCQGREATLVYYTSEREPYTARVENGTLLLANPEKGRGRGGFRFSMFGGGFHVLWNKSSPTVYLDLPADALVDLKIKTGNGSVRVEGLTALCQVDLTTSNSRIDLKNTHCKALDMATSNGRLSLEQVESKQYIQGHTSNSRIEVSGLTAKGKIDLATSNSRIAVSAVRCGSGLTLTTSNGSLNVEGIAAESVALRTSNGNIGGSLPGRQSDWAIDSRASNGRNSLPTSQPGARPLSVHTSNGNISLHFEQGA